jgi:hypothetical protein
VKTELTIDVEPDFAGSWVTNIDTLVDHDVQVAVTAKWRIAQRAKFDQCGQVSHEEWPELVDYTVDEVFVDGKAVALQSLHPDIQVTITNSNEMFKAIERRGAK